MLTRLAVGLGLRDAPLHKITLKIRPCALKELGSPALHLTRRNTYARSQTKTKLTYPDRQNINITVFELSILNLIRNLTVKLCGGRQA